MKIDIFFFVIFFGSWVCCVKGMEDLDFDTENTKLVVARKLFLFGNEASFK